MRAAAVTLVLLFAGTASAQELRVAASAMHYTDVDWIDTADLFRVQGEVVFADRAGRRVALLARLPVARGGDDTALGALSLGLRTEVPVDPGTGGDLRVTSQLLVTLPTQEDAELLRLVDRYTRLHTPGEVAANSVAAGRVQAGLRYDANRVWTRVELAYVRRWVSPSEHALGAGGFAVSTAVGVRLARAFDLTVETWTLNPEREGTDLESSVDVGLTWRLGSFSVAARTVVQTQGVSPGLGLDVAYTR